jgi:uncharacterized Ntn-hydrolase superfamily protein
MIRRIRLLPVLFLLVASPGYAEPVVATFSIVAADPAAGEVGVAVASRFFSVGSVVPFGEGGVGAVATQASADVSFGPRGLKLLAQGVTPEEIATILLRGDEAAGRRQFGIVSVDGVSVTYTGEDCGPWAGGRSGPNYAVQGNILTGQDVVAAMELAFLETTGTLADRMYAALMAGDAKGGDSRGKQSAALIVRKPGTGYGGNDDRATTHRGTTRGTRRGAHSSRKTTPPHWLPWSEPQHWPPTWARCSTTSPSSGSPTTIKTAQYRPSNRRWN